MDGISPDRQAFDSGASDAGARDEAMARSASPDAVPRAARPRAGDADLAPAGGGTPAGHAVPGRRAAAQGAREARPRRRAARRPRRWRPLRLDVVDGRPLPGDHRQRLPAGRQGHGGAAHLGRRRGRDGGRQPGRSTPATSVATIDDRDARIGVEGARAELAKAQRPARRLRGCRRAATGHHRVQPGRRRQCRGRPRHSPRRRPSAMPTC